MRMSVDQLQATPALCLFPKCTGDVMLFIKDSSKPCYSGIKRGRVMQVASSSTSQVVHSETIVVKLEQRCKS